MTIWMDSVSVNMKSLGINHPEVTDSNIWKENVMKRQETDNKTDDDNNIYN